MREPPGVPQASLLTPCRNVLPFSPEACWPMMRGNFRPFSTGSDFFFDALAVVQEIPSVQVMRPVMTMATGARSSLLPAHDEPGTSLGKLLAGYDQIGRASCRER